MLHYTISALTRTGEGHIRQGAASDDVVYCYVSDTIVFCGLADGQSGKQFSAYGGLRVLMEVAGYIERNGVSALCHRRFLDEAQYCVTRVIRSTIDRMVRETGADASEFASTLVVFAFDPKNGDFLSFHLGDGAIIGMPIEKSEPVIVSRPENGITPQYTWVTTSNEALLHLRLHSGNISRYSRIVLLTDGTVSVFRGRALTQRARALFRRQCRSEELLDFVAHNYSEDDASCICVDFI